MGNQRPPMDNPRRPPLQAHARTPSQRPSLQLFQGCVRLLAGREKRAKPRRARLTTTRRTRRMPRKTNYRWSQRVARERKRLERNPEQATCWLCGQPINMTLPPTHARAFTLDHVTPLARGGNLFDETKPAHRACNSARREIRQKHKQTTIEW